MSGEVGAIPYPPEDLTEAVRDIWFTVHDTNRTVLALSRRVTAVEDWQAARRLEIAREQGLREGMSLIAKRQIAIVGAAMSMVVVLVNLAVTVGPRIWG